MENKVIGVIKKHTFKDDICIDDNIKTDLMIDSVSLIDLIMDLEEEFDIEFDDGQINPENFRYVKNIIDNVTSKK